MNHHLTIYSIQDHYFFACILTFMPKGEILAGPQSEVASNNWKWFFIRQNTLASFLNFWTHLLCGLYVCMVEDLAELVEVVRCDDLLDEVDDIGASHTIGQAKEVVLGQEHVGFNGCARRWALFSHVSGLEWEERCPLVLLSANICFCLRGKSGMRAHLYFGSQFTQIPF